MSKISQSALRRVNRRDKLARWVVTLGGGIVIVCVLGILVLIVGTTVPLFLPARARLLAEVPLPASLPSRDVLGLGIDVSFDGASLIGHVVDVQGKLSFVDLASGAIVEQIDCAKALRPGPSDSTPEKDSKPRPANSVAGVEAAGPSTYTLRWSDETASLVQITVPSEKEQKDAGSPKFIVRTLASVPADAQADERKSRAAVKLASMRRSEQGTITCGELLTDNRLTVTRQVVSEDLSGDETAKTNHYSLPGEISGSVSAITLDSAGDMLFAGTSDGSILWWRLADDRSGEHGVVTAFADHRAITALAVMLGDATLVVGDSQGAVTNWLFVKPEGTTPKRLERIRDMRSHKAAIADIVPSARKRAFLVLDRDGSTSLDYTTSSRRLLSEAGGRPLALASLAPRGDVLAGLDEHGHLLVWQLEDAMPLVHDLPLHPEVSFGSLWGRVQYEGYPAPAFVWQSSGGEEYEPKYSLVPLLFGTLKGTLYAMLLAVPLSLAAAAYVSHFTSPALKGFIKPGIELMAAVPSVVLGFLVALWLGPIIESGLLAFFLCFVTVPSVFLLFLLAWQSLRKWHPAERAMRGREFLLMAPVLVAGIASAMAMAPTIERVCFAGNLRQWIEHHLGLQYDQSNCILIALGLGFAVIPIIFSLSEDAMANVPYNMTAASMALGASRWQTLWRVVLPSASPGVFAAIMIGFGRAVGETMIVLMATGNTPIIDFSPLNGMRTLSANIAQEIPEAPAGSTHYRVLFLCAVLLFIITFILNTAAEVVRQRLRKRYGQF